MLTQKIIPKRLYINKGTTNPIKLFLNNSKLCPNLSNTASSATIHFFSVSIY
jgi:hypothetical protein